MLQQTRHSTEPLAPNRDSMRDTILRGVEANKENAIFDVDSFDFPGKAITLYRLTAPKLNMDLSTEFRNSSPDNGFELWRLLNRKLDPPRADLEYHMKNDLRRHARINCTDFSQTVRFVAKLESKRREYQVETGSPLDPMLLADILGAAMDEDTSGRLEGGNVDIKDYDKVRVWIENRNTKMQSRIVGTTLPKDDNKMVYVVDPGTAPQAPAAPSGSCRGACGGCAIHPLQPAEAARPTLPDPWESAQDPWAQGCPPCAPEAQHPSLDPFNKG